MPDLPEALGGRGAHLLGVRIVSLEFREASLDFRIPALQEIVVCIRALRRVFLVIRLGGCMQHLCQASQFGLGFLRAE